MAEVFRAGIGAGIGLAVAGLLLAASVDLKTGLFLIAPFGASAVLIFAVPNSPLAQPWSAIVGNSIAALVGVVACMTVGDPALRVALAVGGSVAAMLLMRAVHPPGGAVAMTAALSPDTVGQLGPWFAFAPVAAGTTILVLAGCIYARATGRHYPMRHAPQSPTPPDVSPVARIGLREEELAAILRNYRQSLNLGTEDLARLIGAAEMQAASHRSGDLTAADIMSRDLVTVGPDTPLGEVANLFRDHGFTSLPVVQEGDKFLGVIFQIHLIRRAREDVFRLDRGFGSAMKRLLDSRLTTPVRAADIMGTAMPRATTGTPVAALLPMMADGICDAVPVLERGRIVGIVTRTDMIAALARRSLSARDN
ncbi:HPP family protein [Falsirhodobacter deserti]|uniref:HPP family protein n=1 Tax=Falsirhodobacter deserti TaxID=1365611 RepID=UPI001F4D9BEF|nr:HPP family protein [Falsirhodobacter deserti]